MTFFIDYSLSPVRKQGLNETVDISVSVRQSNGVPVAGKPVSLKLVKNTAHKIKHIQSNYNFDGLLANLINPNTSGNCNWEGIYKAEIISESTRPVKDFCLSKINKPLTLTEDYLQLEKDFKIQGVRGKKNIITGNGDYIVINNKEFYLISPALSNLKQTYKVKEDIIDVAVDEKDIIYLLTQNHIITFQKGNLKEYSNPVKNAQYIHLYDSKIFLIDKQSCTILRGTSIIDGFDLLQEELNSFHAFKNYLAYTTSDLDKLIILDIKTKEKTMIPLSFLSLPTRLIKIDQDLNIYFAVDKYIFKVQKSSQLPCLEFSFEKEILLESFTISTSGAGILKVKAYNSEKEWDLWEGETDLELKNYVIPLESKIFGIRMEWDGSGSRTISKLFDFFIQGSNNYGQILEPLVLTDHNGIAHFTYLARKFKYSEKFVAIVK